MEETKPHIALGSDHAGFKYKEAIKEILVVEGYPIFDFGTFSADSVDYPDFVHPVANAIEEGEATFGILVCGSGQGVCITANKHQSIRAALAWNKDIAQLSRQHNNANILCLAERFIKLEDAKQIVHAFLQADFEGGRHERRVGKIDIKDKGC